MNKDWEKIKFNSEFPVHASRHALLFDPEKSRAISETRQEALRQDRAKLEAEAGMHIDWNKEI